MSDSPIPGIRTWAEPKQAVWLQDTLTGDSVQIGRYQDALPGTENKMVPVEDGFKALGLSALNRGIQSGTPWFSIDEIGYLECGCREYCEGIKPLMNHKQLIAAVRKQELPFLTELLHREDVCVIDLDAPFPNCGCVIMASGLGVRFGGNKLMADFCGKPMITQILDTTENLFSKCVVVTRHQDVDNLCRQRNMDVVLHGLPHRSDTVRLGLDFLGDSVSSCLFCPGDQPLLTRETLEAMLLAANSAPQQIWQLRYENTPASPVLFPAWAFDELKHLPEGNGGNFLAKKYPEQVRYVPARNSFECMDVDSPADLERLTQPLI